MRKATTLLVTGNLTLKTSKCKRNQAEFKSTHINQHENSKYIYGLSLFALR